MRWLVFVAGLAAGVNVAAHRSERWVVATGAQTLRGEVELSREQPGTGALVDLEELKPKRQSSDELFVGPQTVYPTAVNESAAPLRRRMNNELNFPPNFEGLVVSCRLYRRRFCK